jgi:hypothetical protein
VARAVTTRILLTTAQICITGSMIPVKMRKRGRVRMKRTKMKKMRTTMMIMMMMMMMMMMMVCFPVSRDCPKPSVYKSP